MFIQTICCKKLELLSFNGVGDGVWFTAQFREAGEARAGVTAAMATAPVVATPERSDMGCGRAKAIGPGTRWLCSATLGSW